VQVRMAENGKHIQTNHFLTPEMKAKNLYINRSVDDDSEGRLLRIRQMLEAARPMSDPRQAMEILADKEDVLSGTTEPKSTGNTVAVHTTITSAVIVPALNKMYVANGRGPTSQSRFVEFPLSLDASATLPSDYETVDNDTFKKLYPNRALAEQ